MQHSRTIDLPTIDQLGRDLKRVEERRAREEELRLRDMEPEV
jgi:hypothetical protein